MQVRPPHTNFVLSKMMVLPRRLLAKALGPYEVASLRPAVRGITSMMRWC